MATMHPKLKAYFTEYEVSHRSRGNHACHFIGIPLIIMGAFGLLNRVSFFTLPTGAELTLGLVAYMVLNYFYVIGHRWLGLAMAITTGVLFIVGALLPWQANVAALVVGWALQFIGHFVFEKARPSFFKNFIHVFVGPIYMQKMALRMKD